MHENRETSSLAALCTGSPAGKGGSRNPGMYGDEESDRAIVPMNPANKATGHETAVAEQEEGRVRAKENIGRNHTPPAQDGHGVSQGLAGVREAAKARREEKFTRPAASRNARPAAGQFPGIKAERCPRRRRRDVAGI